MPKYPNNTLPADLGKFILRVTLAVLLLFHGISKMQHGIDQIIGMIIKTGLPPTIAYLVYSGEVLAPALVLIGFWTRLAANSTWSLACAWATTVCSLCIPKRRQRSWWPKIGSWATTP